MVSATRKLVKTLFSKEEGLALTRLCGQCLTDARRSREQHYHPFPFALDYIIKSLLVRHLALGKGKNELFIVLRKDEALEGALIVLDVFHGVNRKGEPFLILQ